MANGLDVSGHSSGRNSLGMPKLDIADDEAVIGQIASGYKGCVSVECGGQRHLWRKQV